MALYPTIEPVSVSKLAVVVICPHCGDEHHHQMQQAGRAPIRPGDKLLFRSTCTITNDPYTRHWTLPNQIGYFIQFPARKATP